MLFDHPADPGEKYPITDAKVEQRMTDHLVRLLRKNDAPTEQFTRYELPVS